MHSKHSKLEKDYLLTKEEQNGWNRHPLLLSQSSFPMSERTRGDVQLHWVAAKEAFMVQ